METNARGAKCPACQSTNTHIYKRGYSFLLGLLGAGAFTIAYLVWTIISTGYAELDEVAKTVVLLDIKFSLIWPVLLGLLCGFIGKNEMRAKCLDCGKTFRV